VGLYFSDQRELVLHPSAGVTYEPYGPLYLRSLIGYDLSVELCHQGPSGEPLGAVSCVRWTQ